MKKYPGLVFLTDEENVQICLNVRKITGLRNSDTVYYPRNKPGVVIVLVQPNEAFPIKGSVSEILDTLVEAGWGQNE